MSPRHIASLPDDDRPIASATEAHVECVKETGVVELRVGFEYG